ncbi:ABC transporter permease subunit [Streptomyces sp. 6N223]|uniref:ABC transporter permease subunit n=1 Tax=Streptomyces sp. 6N223 TaxID=3457412 RepID=UPI003FD0E7E2
MTDPTPHRRTPPPDSTDAAAAPDEAARHARPQGDPGSARAAEGGGSGEKRGSAEDGAAASARDGSGPERTARPGRAPEAAQRPVGADGPLPPGRDGAAGPHDEASADGVAVRPSDGPSPGGTAPGLGVSARTGSARAADRDSTGEGPSETPPPDSAAGAPATPSGREPRGRPARRASGAARSASRAEARPRRPGVAAAAGGVGPMAGASRRAAPGQEGHGAGGHGEPRAARATAFSRLWRVRELGILLALALLVAGTAASNSRFLSAQSIRDVLLAAAILVVLAVGQTVVIVTRNIDLSVGSVLGLAAFATGKLFVEAPDTALPLALLAGMALGAACGVVNGALIAAARVPALVITLGTLYIFRGIDHSWASGEQINAADMPGDFLRLGTARVLGIDWLPWLAVIAAAVLLVVGYYLHSHRSGRELYAIGSEPAAARLSGIPVGRRVFVAFVISGSLAGLAGVLYAARFGTVDATVGSGMELQVVAAAVVGGVAIFGGSGTVYGAALGALLLTTIDSSLAVLRVNPFWQQAVVGGLILAAIGLDRALAARVAVRLRRRQPRGT